MARRVRLATQPQTKRERMVYSDIMAQRFPNQRGAGRATREQMLETAKYGGVKGTGRGITRARGNDHGTAG